MAPTTKLLLFTVVLIPLFLLPFCSGCIPSEREALLRFKSALNYSSRSYSYFYTDLSSWENGGDCCLWQGISCHNTTNYVVAVDIQSYYGWEGVISESLCTLTSLATIRLTSMGLTGTVPPCLGNLSSLSVLDLYNFSGAIPNSIVEMTWLETLDFSTNNFSGQIPPDLGSLSYLEALNFSNNQFTGSIPQGGHMATFSESSYLGNPNLWGCPLPKKCSWPEFTLSPPPISTSDNGEEQSEESVWYDIGVGLSYVAGFTTVLVFIVLEKKYFEGVDKILKILFPWIRNLTL